ncbi:MAG: formylglycine-generating enzyme family protein [Deltaproteobacteria bacterium]|nr:formylglycine-generating enzyme family protein [Deltaproteobacteria bacterium]
MMGNRSKKSCIMYMLFCVLFLSGMFLPSHIHASEKGFRNSLGMEFVLIPAGAFIMGSPVDEAQRRKGELQHRVTISRPFYMQTTEVTLKQWRDMMGRKLFGRRKGKGTMPVTRVSWHDCRDFIKKLNALQEGTYRLPTEAEWEYACRAGSSTAFSWGYKADCKKAMFANNSLKSEECLAYVKSKRRLLPDSPAPVKSYPPNAWGLYDMHGNVWEWCQDWLGPYPPGLVKDPSGPESGPGRVRRGGSWFKYGHSCRSANRAYGHPPTRYRTTGFRLVRELRESP